MEIRAISLIRSVLQCMNSSADPNSYIHPQSERIEHYREIHSKMAQFLPSTFPKFSWAGYSGPWLEELWALRQNSDFSHFGPFVPVFVQWVHLWVNHRDRYDNFTSRIFALLEPQYLYITLSHNDDGIEGGDCENDRIPKNLFVMSQGGKGHIPLLLWLKPENVSNHPIADRYELDVVFMGSPGSHWVRGKIFDKINKTSLNSYFGWGGDWKERYATAKFVLCPRGYGRNSYRLGEVLQMGMLPIYLYSDILWLPYYDSINWSRFSFVVHANEIETMDGILEQIQKTSAEKVREMRQIVHGLYETHFSVDGVFNQVMRFFTSGFQKSDLRCARYSARRDGAL